MKTIEKRGKSGARYRLRIDNGRITYITKLELSDSRHPWMRNWQWVTVWAQKPSNPIGVRKGCRPWRALVDMGYSDPDAAVRSTRHVTFRLSQES